MSSTPHADAVDGDTEVLQFELGDETYCIDIEYVAEIVDREEETTIPNAPQHVVGVLDLRGETTTIVDPKRVLNVAGEGGRRVVVLDADSVDAGGAVGWLVDEVDRVLSVDSSAVETDPVADSPGVRGVLERDGGFVIWLDPTAISA